MPNDSNSAAGGARYEREISRRLRRSSLAARARAFALQSNWIVILAAGAAVSLSAALDWDDWVGPVLGFVVVIGTGVDRIFSRTTEGSIAVDRLRRELERQRRLYEARQLMYSDNADPFGSYVARVEAAIAEYDEAMVSHSSRLTRGESN